MTRCTEYVPTVVEVRQVHEDVPACHRHIVSSARNGGFWTLCGQWIPMRRLRILKVERGAGTIRVREEEQRIQSWPWCDVHRTCALEHLRRKREYRIGSGAWTWLWRAPEKVVNEETAPGPLTVAEARTRLNALAETPRVAERRSWWRRWFPGKEKVA